MIPRLIAGLMLSSALFAQMPKGIYAWWSTPVVLRELNLSPNQEQQMRATVREYRPHLVELRTELNLAEQDLEYQFNQDPIDSLKADRAIERLISARSDLTRTLSRMSLKLRTLLTEQQWQQLQQRRPVRGQSPVESSR